MTGVGALMGKLTELEEVPPGLTTLMVALPVLAMRVAATEALSCVELTKVVGSAAPFHCTVAPERKPVPFTVSMKGTPDAVAELGLRLVMLGADGALIGKVIVFEEVPPAFTTVKLMLPCAANQAADKTIVSCVALTNVGEKAKPFTKTVEMESGKKSVPLTVSVSAGPPAVAELGLKLVIDSP